MLRGRAQGTCSGEEAADDGVAALVEALPLVQAGGGEGRARAKPLNTGQTDDAWPAVKRLVDGLTAGRVGPWAGPFDHWSTV